MGANRQHTEIDQVEDLVNENYAFFRPFARAPRHARQSARALRQMKNQKTSMNASSARKRTGSAGGLADWRSGEGLIPPEPLAGFALRRQNSQPNRSRLRGRAIAVSARSMTYS